MVISGIDYSKKSPACVKFILDDNLDIVKCDYLGFVNIKKYALSKDILFYEKNNYVNEFNHFIWLSEKIFEFVKESEYVSFENYSYGSVGRLCQLAEGTGILKYQLIKKHDIKLRLYEPTRIKKFATSQGSKKADKFLMEEFYEKDKDKIDLSFLPLVKEEKNGNPKDNIVDAFFIAKLLLLELKVRKGFVLLKDLPEYIIEIFNAVTKSNPENLLVREFISYEPK